MVTGARDYYRATIICLKRSHSPIGRSLELSDTEDYGEGGIWTENTYPVVYQVHRDPIQVQHDPGFPACV